MAVIAEPRAIAGPLALAEPLALKAAAGRPACYIFRKVFRKPNREILTEPQRFVGG